MEYILSSLDMYDSMSSNLIDYTFNVSVSPPFSLAPLTVFTDEFVSNERGDAKINPNHNHLPATNPTNRLFRECSTPCSNSYSFDMSPGDELRAYVDCAS